MVSLEFAGPVMLGMCRLTYCEMYKLQLVTF
jgi:hypothetical protein